MPTCVQRGLAEGWAQSISTTSGLWPQLNQQSLWRTTGFRERYHERESTSSEIVFSSSSTLVARCPPHFKIIGLTGKWWFQCQIRIWTRNLRILCRTTELLRQILNSSTFSWAFVPSQWQIYPYIIIGRKIKFPAPITLWWCLNTFLSLSSSFFALFCRYKRGLKASVF